tara:strand:+ start:1186 stop:3348 length:2163 start_codon:yes stop_codon:yes gene_type:complete
MALTSGEKQNKATVSSIQSRMGVVDAANVGNPLGLAAEGASKVLDVFAERQANIEEVSWKTDFKLKSREALLNLSRVHYDDPDAFTKATNSYRDSLVNEAPNRFKNYAKEFIGNIAFEYGDQIWQEAKSQKTILEISNWSNNYKDFIAQRNSIIMTKPASDFQDYWTQSLLPEMADTMADYEKLYNSYDASIQSQLASQKGFGTPEEFNKALELGFETQRLISLTAKDLNNAQALDTAYIQQMGEIPDNYETEVSKVLKQYQLWGTKYIDKPNHDTDDASVYINTNREDRAGIITSVEKYIDSWKVVNEKNIKKQDIILSQDKEVVVQSTVAEIEDGFTKSTQEIRVIANNNNLTEKQLDRLIDINTLTVQVQDLSKQISSYGKNESGNYQVNANMTEFDVNSLIFNKTKYLNDLGIEITQEELKDKAMMQQMFSIISTTPEFDDNITQSVFNNMDLSKVVASGATGNNIVTNSLVELSRVYGQVPTILENYFSSMDSFNFEVQADRQELRNMAEFANNLSKTKGRPLAFGDSEGNKNFANLVELHEELQKVGRLNNKIADLTEKQINDLNLDVGEYEKLIIEKWVSKTYPEQTVLDEKIEFMNNVIGESGTDFNRMMENFFEDQQEDGPWWGFGFVDTDLLTGNNEFNIMGRDKDLQPSFNLVMQEAGEQIFVRVASMFDNQTYKVLMTEDSIKSAFKKQLPYILNTIRTIGYGYDENI